MKTESRTVLIGVRLPESLANKVVKMADEEHRKVAPTIAYIVDLYFKSRGE